MAAQFSDNSSPKLHSSEPPNQDDKGALGPSDAKSVCYVGSHLITSPNMDSIPLPQWSTADVRICCDFRYGEDDYTLWPQEYIEEYCHLGAIPCKPSDPSNPLAVMWWDPCEADFVVSSGSLYDGFGMLAPEKYRPLEQLCSALSKQTRAYLKTSQKPDYTLHALLKSMEHAYSRLEWCASSYTKMRFAVTELQRYFLEVHGLLDYLTIYKPRMDGIEEGGPIASCVGAFTTKPRVAQDFFDARLPVYLVRPVAAISALPSPPTILKVVEPLHPAQYLELHDAERRFPTVFKGLPNTPQKHAAMHRYSRTWMVYQSPYDHTAAPASTDPFLIGGLVANASHVRVMADLMKDQLPTETDKTLAQGPAASTSSNPNLGSSRTSMPANPSSNPAKPTEKTTVKRRDPFKDYVSDFLPPLVPTWVNALQKTQHNERRIYHPYIIVTPTENAKKTVYLLTYLCLRPALLVLLRQERHLVQHLRVWRELLELGRNSGVNQSSYAAQNRQKVQEILEPVLAQIGSFQLSMLETPDAFPVSWRHHRLPVDKLPPVQVFHEVLWELNEINFRVELISLDRQASTSTTDHSTRLDWILNCFPDGHVVPAHIPVGNEGLVAVHWKGRVPYALSFVQVVRHWQGAPSALRSLTREELNGFLSERRLYDLENTAAKFYTQSFWDYFGRAPTLPRRII